VGVSDMDSDVQQRQDADETASTSQEDLSSAADYRLSESPAHLLRRAQQFASEIFADKGLSDGVTQRQSVVLAAIAEREGLSQSELVSATGIDRSTLADMIARMQSRGMVSREAAEEDARAKSVRLTQVGRDMLNTSRPALVAADEAILERLPRNRRKAFVDLLLLLASAADQRGVMETGDLSQKTTGEKKKKKKKKKKKSDKKS